MVRAIGGGGFVPAVKAGILSVLFRQLWHARVSWQAEKAEQGQLPCGPPVAPTRIAKWWPTDILNIVAGISSERCLKF
jgi:hypothetical protein